MAWLPHRLSFRDLLPRPALLHGAFKALAWLDAPLILKALGPRLGVRGRALVTSAEVLFAKDVDLEALTLCAEKRNDCQAPIIAGAASFWGEERCCSARPDAPIARGRVGGAATFGKFLDERCAFG